MHKGLQVKQYLVKAKSHRAAQAQQLDTYTYQSILMYLHLYNKSIDQNLHLHFEIYLRVITLNSAVRYICTQM